MYNTFPRLIYIYVSKKFWIVLGAEQPIWWQ